MKINSIGTNADMAAKVDISKVHGGYFSDLINVRTVSRPSFAEGFLLVRWRGLVLISRVIDKCNYPNIVNVDIVNKNSG